MKFGQPVGLPTVTCQVESGAEFDLRLYLDEVASVVEATDELVREQPPVANLEREFQPGDKVRIVGNCNSHQIDLGSTQTLRCLAKGSSFSKERGWGWHVEGHGAIVLREIDFVLADPVEKSSASSEWTPKFKVGDKVKAVMATHGWGDVGKGDIGVITRVPKAEGQSYFADFPAFDSFDSFEGWEGEEECFELVTSAQEDEPFFSSTGNRGFKEYPNGVTVFFAEDEKSLSLFKGKHGDIGFFKRPSGTVGVRQIIKGEWKVLDTQNYGGKKTGYCSTCGDRLHLSELHVESDEYYCDDCWEEQYG